MTVLLAIILKWGFFGIATIVFALFDYRPSRKLVFVALGLVFIIIAFFFVLGGMHILTKAQLKLWGPLLIGAHACLYFYNMFNWKRNDVNALTRAIQGGKTNHAIGIALDVIALPRPGYRQFGVELKPMSGLVALGVLHLLEKMPNKAERIDVAIASLQADVQAYGDVQDGDKQEYRKVRREFIKHARELSRAAGFPQLG